MGFPFRFKKFLRSPKRRRRPERSGGQKILKIDLLEALRMALNFSNFLRLFQAIILAQNTSFDKILQSQKINCFKNFFGLKNFGLDLFLRPPRLNNMGEIEPQRLDFGGG